MFSRVTRKAGAGHHAVEKHDGVGDRAGGEILRHGERGFQQRVRHGSAIVALGDADTAEIFGGCAIGAHVGVGEQGEARVGAAGGIGVGCVGGEAAEARQHAAEGIGLVGVTGDTGDEVGVAGLHRAGGAAQRHRAGGAAGGDMVEPAGR
jgi:hypothetical protein